MKVLFVLIIKVNYGLKVSVIAFKLLYLNYSIDKQLQKRPKVLIIQLITLILMFRQFFLPIFLFSEVLFRRIIYFLFQFCLV